LSLRYVVDFKLAAVCVCYWVFLHGVIDGPTSWTNVSS